MPFIINGKYKSMFGGLDEPIWLDADDLSKTKFTRKNSGIVVITNSKGDIGYSKNWKAISVEFFDKLYDRANMFDDDKKMSIIRQGSYLYFII